MLNARGYDVGTADGIPGAKTREDVYKRQGQESAVLLQDFIGCDVGGAMAALGDGELRAPKARRHPRPVSYTHLDVYKRQAQEAGLHQHAVRQPVRVQQAQVLGQRGIVFLQGLALADLSLIHI